MRFMTVAVSISIGIASLTSASLARAFDYQGPAASGPRFVDWEIRIEGEIVDATVDVIFTGDASEPHAGELRFPLPPLAVLRGAEIYRDDVQAFVAGETMGRRDGEQVYREESADSAAQPLLVQEIGRDAYRAIVSPIVDGQDLALRLHYAHLLEGVGSTRILRVAIGNTDAIAPSIDGASVQFSVDPGAFSSATLVDQREGTTFTFDPENGSGLVSIGAGPLEGDIEIELVATTPREVSSLGYRSTDASVPDHILVRAAPPISTFAGTKTSERAVIFVLDRSGSMNGQRFTEAKSAITQLIDALGPNDRFGVVWFSNDAQSVTASLVDAGEVGAKETVRATMETWGVLGGTNMEAGLREAARLLAGSQGLPPTAELFFVSDGYPTSGQSSAAGLANILRTEIVSLDIDVRLFALGIGYDLAQEFLNTLVAPHDGEATFALADNEIAGQALLLFESARPGGLRSPTLSIVVDGTPFSSVPTRTLHDDAVVSIGAPIDDAAPFQGDVQGDEPSARIALQGRSGDGPQSWLSPLSSTSFTGTGVARAVPALGAKVRADALARRAEIEGETEEILVEALFLAKHYGIVTRYSSIVVLPDDARYEELGIARVPRDAAGIALVEVDTSEATDEARIGGEGGTYYGGGYTGLGGGGCACVGEPRARIVGILGALALVGLLWPRRRTRASSRT